MFRKEKGFIPHLKKGAGFTLIELLIVIAVIGILAAAILPKFIAFDLQAKCASTQGSLSSLRAALALYRAKKEVFPTKMSGLVPTYITKIPFAQMPSLSNATATTGTIPGAAGVGWVMDRTLGEIWLKSTGSTDADGSGVTEADEYYTNW